MGIPGAPVSKFTSSALAEAANDMFVTPGHAHGTIAVDASTGAGSAFAIAVFAAARFAARAALIGAHIPALIRLPIRINSSPIYQQL